MKFTRANVIKAITHLKMENTKSKVYNDDYKSGYQAALSNLEYLITVVWDEPDKTSI